MIAHALIVDDEPLCRERILTLLERWPQIEVVGECGLGAEAVHALQSTRVDLLFLDIQMPDVDGFDVMERAGVERVPLVIFVTGHADYAVDAFEVHAFDYLLKPIRRERFESAVERALREIPAADERERRARLGELLRTVRPSAGTYVERLLVRDGHRGRAVFLRADDVDWFQADGNYVAVHVGSAIHLIRQSMAGFERRLDPASFLRINRGTLVNLDAIRELQPGENDEYVAVLRGGQRLPVSRRCRQQAEARFGRLE